MPEANFAVGGYNAGRIRLEPTETRGEGGSDYPRLVIMLTYAVSPLRISEAEMKKFVILSAQGNLTLQDQPYRFSEGITLMTLTVHHPNNQFNYAMDFPLDLYRLEKIGEKRKGDLKLRLDLSLFVGTYKSFPVQTSGQLVRKEVLGSLEREGLQIAFEIPQSHWVGKILPGLGYGKAKILEIPLPNEGLPKEFEESLGELVAAQDFFSKGDNDKAVAHCRSAIDPLREKLPELRNAMASDTDYSWVKELAEGTGAWLDGIYKTTRSISSKTHQLPSLGHFSRHDAQAIILVTTALVSYVGRLSSAEDRE